MKTKQELQDKIDRLEVQALSTIEVTNRYANEIITLGKRIDTQRVTICEAHEGEAKLRHDILDHNHDWNKLKQEMALQKQEYDHSIKMWNDILIQNKLLEEKLSTADWQVNHNASLLNTKIGEFNAIATERAALQKSIMCIQTERDQARALARPAMNVNQEIDILKTKLKRVNSDLWVEQGRMKFWKNHAADCEEKFKVIRAKLDRVEEIIT